MATAQEAANHLAALLRQAQPEFKTTATTLTITQRGREYQVNLQQRQTGGRSVQGR